MSASDLRLSNARSLASRAVAVRLAMAALVALMLIGCGKKGGPDPVVGVWVDNFAGEVIFDFRTDGTVVNSTDYDRMLGTRR